jgi:bifunctional DNA-binding transcriptional regulator/antitoxin component of YhaV-PrlF toxin-antitoxin module
MLENSRFFVAFSGMPILCYSAFCKGSGIFASILTPRLEFRDFSRVTARPLSVRGLGGFQPSCPPCPFLIFLCFFAIIKSKKICILYHYSEYTKKGKTIMLQTAQLGGNSMLKKRISVSQKRQITIPIEFFNSLGIEKEVECYLQNNALVIRPVRENTGEFDEQILADLISQGLSGTELLERFKEMRRKVRPAVEHLLDEARLAAAGKARFSTYEDVFGTEDE